MSESDAIVKAIIEAEEWTGGPLAYDTDRFTRELAKHGYMVVPTAALTEAVARERERCARVAERVGNFGDYKRDELTRDYGQPRFDMMTDIAAAIRTPPVGELDEEDRH